MVSRKRHKFTAIGLSLLLIAVLVIIGMWHSDSDHTPIAATSTTAPRALEVDNQRDAPVLLVPTPAEVPVVKPPADKEHSIKVLVRAADDKDPIEGAVVTIVRDDGSVVANGTTRADGTVAIPVEVIEPVAVRVDGPPPFRTRVVGLDKHPEAQVAVALLRGALLEIRTVDLVGDAIPDVALVVRRAGAPEPGDEHAVQTNERGVVIVPNLAAGQKYSVEVQGWSRPLEANTVDYVTAGTGTVHTLRLGRPRIVWGRAVDNTSDATVASARWLLIHGTTNPSLVPAHLGELKRVLKPGIKSEPGDRWTCYLHTREGDDMRLGPYRVVAPGYEERTDVYLEARPARRLEQGPVVVKMTPIGGSLATLQIDLDSTVEFRTMLRVKRGTSSVFNQLVGGTRREVRVPLPSGDYSIYLGGNLCEEISISSAPRVHFVRIALGSLPSLRIVLRAPEGQATYEGLATMIVSTKGMSAGFTNVVFTDGRSPRLIVPPQRVTIAVQSSDDRLTVPIQVVITEGEHLEKTLELLDMARALEQMPKWPK